MVSRFIICFHRKIVACIFDLLFPKLPNKRRNPGSTLGVAYGNNVNKCSGTFYGLF